MQYDLESLSYANLSSLNWDKMNMTSRNFLRGRFKPSEKLTREEFAALGKLTMSNAPPAKLPVKKGGGPQGSAEV